MDKILLTGASGNLGKKILNWVEVYNKYSDKIEVVCLDRAHGFDLSNNSFLPAITPDITHVIHAAANTSFSPDKNKIFSVNVQGTSNLLDAVFNRCQGLKRFTYVSTAWQCGVEGKHVIPYTESKVEAEALVRNYPKTIITRPSILMDTDTCSITWVFLLAYALRKFTFDLNQAIDVVKMDDAASAILELTVMDDLEDNLFHISSNYSQQTFARIFGEIDQHFGSDFCTAYEKPDTKTLDQYILDSDTDEKIKRICTYVIRTFGAIAAQGKLFDNASTKKALKSYHPTPLTHYIKACVAYASKFSLEEMIEQEMK